MQQSYAPHIARSTVSAAASATPSASCTSRDTLFRLECVLLFALDVVRGPYIHSCAPAHPPEAIRSFLESQTVPASSPSPAAASPAEAAASSAAGFSGVRRESPSLPPHSAPEKDSTEMMSDLISTRRPADSRFNAATAAPNTTRSTAAVHPSSSCGACSIDGDDNGLVAASFSSTMPAPPSSLYSASSPMHPLTTAADASPSSEFSSLQRTTGTPLLKEQQLFPSSLAIHSGAAAGLPVSVLGDMTGDDVRDVSLSVGAQGHLVGPSNATTQAETRASAMDTSGTIHTASEGNAAFSFSPQASTSEPELTPPRPAPKVSSFSFVASQSTGDGDALAKDTSPDEYGNESKHSNDDHGPDVRSEAARAAEGRTDAGSGTPPTQRLAKASAATTTTDVYRSSTSSPNATPVRTSPATTAPTITSSNSGVAIPGATTESCAVAEGQQHHHHPQHLPPHSPQVWSSLRLGTTALARGTPLPPTCATAATTAADKGRMSGYNDVFVPRSEFCRRVLWLYPAESGLLFLYYPEDIPGEHYQRKTLRYSLCLVFRVDHKRMTIGDGQLHQLVHPYSVVLTNIAEELREAELKYAYMIRGLRSFDSVPWQVSRLMPKPPISSLPTAAVKALSEETQSPETSCIAAGGHVAAAPGDFCEGLGEAHLATPSAVLSNAPQKPYTRVRGWVTGKTNTMAPSTATATAVAITASATFDAASSPSASPHSYNLPFLGNRGTEPSVASVTATVGGTNRLHHSAEMTSRTSTSLVSLQQPTLPSPGDKGSEARGSAETATATISGGCSSQYFEDNAHATHGARGMDDKSLRSVSHAHGDFSSLSITAAAASNTAHASPSSLSTSFVPAAGANVGSCGGSAALIAVEGFHVATSGARSASSHITHMESFERTTPSLSSLPVRCRSRSVTAATYLSSVQPPALEQSASIVAMSSATCSSFSVTATPASASSVTLSSAVKAHYGVGRQQQQQQHSMASAGATTPPRAPSPCHGLAPSTTVVGTGGSAASGSSRHILNAFITPPTEPKWTPLSELVDELFRCLSCTEAPDGHGDRERDGPMGSPTADGRASLTASSITADAALGLAAQQPEGALSAGMSNKALVQRSTPTTAASSNVQQQQRGDTSVVHLSNRLSFHVRRMAPLRPARLLHLDHVPVPVVAYDPQMMEWMDMAVHHVFRLVDGARTVADLVFGVAMGTTTTLAEVYADALRRSVAVQKAIPATAASASSAVAGTSATQRCTTSTRNRLRGAAVKAAASLSVPGAAVPAEALVSGESATDSANLAGRGPCVAGNPSQSVVVSVPINVHSCSSLLPGVRYTAPTSAAAAISDGQAQLPSYVNVRVTPGAASGVGAPVTRPPVCRGAKSLGTAVPIASEMPDSSSMGSTTASSPSPQISVELPQTWVATAGIVMEALLHLELCHLIKVYRPWTEKTLYSLTHSAQQVLCCIHHPARLVLGRYLLCIRWVERQESRAERRRAIAEWTQIQNTRVKVRREVQRATVASRAATSVVTEKHHASTLLGTVSNPPQSPTAAEVPSPHVPPSSTAPEAALAMIPSSDLDSRAAVTNATVDVRSPARLIDRSGWSPPLAPRLPSSAPCASGMHCSEQHQQLPHQSPSMTPIAYPSSPSMPYSPSSDAMVMGAGAGANARGLELSSTVTHASSNSTSLAPSSLQHALSIGASGKLQLTLMNSLPTFSLLRTGVGSAEAVSSASKKLFVGSQVSQTCGGGLLPCAVTGASYGSSPEQQLLRRYQHFHSHGFSRAAPLRSCSGTSSSEDSGTAVSRRSSSPEPSSVSSDSGNSSVSSSSSSGNPIPRSTSSMQPLAAPSSAGANAARGSVTPSKVEAIGWSSPAPSVTGELMRFQASNGAATTDLVSRCAQHPPKSPSGDGAAVERPTAEPAATSALRATEGQSTGVAAAKASQRERRRRRRPPLTVFTPTEAEVSRATAAALCALAKFSNASVSSVQEEMRRIPVWATSFNRWSDRCMKALVEVAILNNWLDDVSS
ncbi:hypothetical protein, conserved [Leishmania tarentolae]|uniref:Uncharacterized protein n=1 Tax=Leishmania tarentolae TaxID=5689 RepID=A0A640KFS5_LEITA|nr:hypothetical protein, conserved [Leishmania tarentolae]